ncbi:MAG: hypothetical protein ACTSR8_10045 [Promethearchaeota archaeon]
MNSLELDSEIEKIETLNSLIYKSFQDLSISYKKAFRSQIWKQIFHLGALLNDTNYKQQKYFKTSGIQKKIIPFVKYITWSKVLSLFNYCYRLQYSISKKEYRKFPEILKVVKNYKDKFKIDNSVAKVELNNMLTTGFNLYGVAVIRALQSFNKENREVSIRPALPEFCNLAKYKESHSFQLGYLLGYYFFIIDKAQREVIKTKGLQKKLPTMLRNPNYRSISLLYSEINLIALKLLSFQKDKKSNQEWTSTKEKKSHSGIVLLGYKYQLSISELLLKFIDKSFKLSRIDFIMGFGAAFSYFYGFYLRNKGETDNIVQNLEIHKDTKGKIIITEALIYSNFLKLDLDKIEEQIAYLQGILVKNLIKEEKNKLDTERMLKNFYSLFRNYNNKSIVKMQSEIFYTLIRLWIYSMGFEEGKKTKSLIDYNSLLVGKLIELIGLLDRTNSRENPGAGIKFIQGYQLFSRLYKYYNQ